MPRGHQTATRITSESVNNQLWTLLPGATRERLIRFATRVHLQIGERVFEARERPRAVYFPESAVVSRVAHLHDGEILEMGLIGRDGMAGISVLPGLAMTYDGVVQVTGMAVKIDAGAVTEELQHLGKTHEVLCNYAFMILSDGIQLGACNNFHPVSQRCARWLLMMNDVVGVDDFPITQELLSHMLGVRRATITRAAQALNRAGLIEYKHGRMVLRDRRGLESTSCECYRTMREWRQTLLGTHIE